MNVPVFVADEHSAGMCQGSRFPSKKLIYHSFYKDESQFIHDIQQISQKYHCSFLFPSHDETEIIARHRTQFDKKILIPVSTSDKIQLANDKLKIAKHAQKFHLPIPKTVLYDPECSFNDIPFPVVLKLRRSNSAKGVFYPTTREDIHTVATQCILKYKLSPERFPIIQEKVTGEGWGVSCLYWEGKRLAFFTHKRLREKTLTGGTSTARISLRNPIIEEIAFKLLDTIEWHGLAMVEFKFNPDTQEAWIIEVNPRLWGSIYLAVISGVDFPAWLYLAATKGPKPVKELFKGQCEGVIARWYLGEIIYAIQMIQKGKIKEALKCMSPFPLNHLDDFHLDDPGAFIGELVYYATSFLRNKNLNPECEGMLG